MFVDVVTPGPITVAYKLEPTKTVIFTIPLFILAKHSNTEMLNVDGAGKRQTRIVLSEEKLAYITGISFLSIYPDAFFFTKAFEIFAASPDSTEYRRRTVVSFVESFIDIRTPARS